MAKRTYETAAQLRNLKRPQSGQQDYYDTLAPRLDPPVIGLVMRVSVSGRKSFTLNYAFKGKMRRDQLGLFSEIHSPHDALPEWHSSCPLTLKEARAVGAHIRALAAVGIDPRLERERAEAEREAAKELTYKKAVDRYLKIYHIQKKGNKSAGLTHARLLRVDARWHNISVSEISQQDIESALEEVMDRNQIYEANRRHSALKHFFSWLKKRKLIGENPAVDIDRPSDGEKPRERFWSDEEIVRIWKSADGLDATRAAWLRLMILTGARPSEISGMKIDELDLEKGVLVIPAARHKTGRKVKKPISFELSSLSVRILKSLIASHPTKGGFVFSGEGTHTGEPNSITLNSRLRIRIRKLSGVDDFYAYSARHTYTTGLANLKVPRHIIDACTNHVPKGSTAGYIHTTYSDEMRAACEAWAEKIEALVYGEKVVGLRG